jgi:diguanylate cyclase (GGDEF)-like protein/PAS domain S-box-containing protein
MFGAPYASSEVNGGSFAVTMDAVLDETAANAMLASSPDALVLVDPAFVVRWVNAKAVRVFGWPFHELVGRSALELIHADDLAIAARVVSSIQQDATVGRTTLRIMGPDNQVVSVTVVATVLGEDSVLGPGVLISARLPGLSSQPGTDDVDRVGMFEVIDRMPEAVVVYVRDVGFVFRNRAAVRLFRVPGRDPRLTFDDSNFEGNIDVLRNWLSDYGDTSFGPTQLELVHADGDRHHLDVTGSSLVDNHGETTGRILSFNDITSLITVQGSLHRMAYQDELTGLANRRALDEYLHAASTPQTMVIIDVDHFNEINDAYGHSVGDAVLVEVTRRLTEAVGPDGLTARLGGDEFVVVIPTLRIDPGAFVEGLRRALLPILPAPLPPEAITASFGVSTTDSERDASVVLTQADAALYAAKGAGRNCVRRYVPGLTMRSHQHLSAQRVLRDALDASTVRIAFQPIVSTTSGRTVSAEALIRVDGSTIAPSALIEAAERTGQIQQVDRISLARTLDLLIATAEYPDFVVACNASVLSIAQPDWGDTIETELRRVGVDPARLVIECAERGLLGLDTAALDNLRRVRSIGVRVAIDDFGVEQAGFGVLSETTFDILKIDSRFVQRSVQETIDRAILEAIVQLTQTIGLEVIAEGVETEAQRALLVSLGVDLVQGHLVQAAGTPDQIVERLATWSALERS